MDIKGDKGIGELTASGGDGTGRFVHDFAVGCPEGKAIEGNGGIRAFAFACEDVEIGRNFADDVFKIEAGSSGDGNWESRVGGYECGRKRAVIAALLDDRAQDIGPEGPVPAERGIDGVCEGAGDIAAEEHEAASAIDDGLIGHVAGLS